MKADFAHLRKNRKSAGGERSLNIRKDRSGCFFNAAPASGSILMSTSDGPSPLYVFRNAGSKVEASSTV